MHTLSRAHKHAHAHTRQSLYSSLHLQQRSVEADVLSLNYQIGLRQKYWHVSNLDWIPGSRKYSLYLQFQTACIFPDTHADLANLRASSYFMLCFMHDSSAEGGKALLLPAFPPMFPLLIFEPLQCEIAPEVSLR